MKEIYHGGTVYLGAGAFAEGFIVENGTFSAVGCSDELKGAARTGDRTIDLMGKFVCAGFNDSHMHLLNFGASLRTAQLDAHTGSLDDMINCLKDFAKAHPPTRGAWLIGRGWNQDCFTDAVRMPTRYDLDRVSTAFPVAAVRCCGHCMAVNSAALRAIGIGEHAPEIAGGRFGMQNGVPDGLIYDNAMDYVYAAMPAPKAGEIKEMIMSACDALNACGVTSCQSDDYFAFRGVSWRDVNAAYRELASNGKLTVRITEQSNFDNLEAFKVFLKEEWPEKKGGNMFRIGPLKMLGDGSLGSRTAYLSRPYADAPDTRGIRVIDQKTLQDMILCAHEHGMQIAVHAIGDACLDDVLCAYEKALKKHPRADHRHGIVHCQVTRREQLQKMIDRSLHIYAQSIFLDYDSRIVENRVGKSLAETSYHWKTLLRGGLTVSNGTDCPVEHPDPLRGITCAVTRAPLARPDAPYLPEQRFSVAEALDSYTLAGAKASFEEHVKGMIAPGMLADFSVLEKSPFSVPPASIQDIKVLETYLGGACVFHA